MVSGCGASSRTSSAIGTSVRPKPTLAPVSFTPTTAFPAPPSHANVLNSSQIVRLLKGVGQSGPRLGDPNARVSVTLYGDLECPICRAFVLGAGFAKFVARDVRAGNVSIIYRGFETATRDPRIFKIQQVAALAAGRQDRFWQFTMLFLLDQGTEGTAYVTSGFLDGLAGQVPGLNFEQWIRDRNDPRFAKELAHDISLGTRLGVVGTPTLIFQGPRGRAQPSAAVPSYNDLRRLLKKVA